MRFVTIVLASLALAAPALATHPSRTITRLVNLDADAVKEKVVAVALTSADHTQQTAYVHLQDRCRGSWRTFDLSGTQRTLGAFAIVNADGVTKRPEIFFSLGAADTSSPGGIAEVVRLDDRRGACASPRTLFVYRPGQTVPPPPKLLVSWDVRLADVSPEFAGKEVTLSETFKAPPSEVCCLDISTRVRQYRYDRGRRQYVVYSDKTIVPA
jgi:hypothetical protein